MKKNKFEILPIRGVPVTPFSIVPFVIGRKFSLKAVRNALRNDDGRLVLMFQKDYDIENPSIDSFYEFGVLVKVLKPLERVDENYNTIVEGISFVSIKSIMQGKGDRFFGDFEILNFEIEDTIENNAKISLIKDLFLEASQYSKLISRDLASQILTSSDKLFQLFIILSNLNLKLSELDKLIQSKSISKIIDFVISSLNLELEVSKVKKSIEDKVKKSIEQAQKHVFLNEQLKAIKDELGDNEKSDADEFIAKLASIKNIKTKYREKISKEISKLEYIPKHASEYMVVYNYLTMIFDLPWDNFDKDEISFEKSIDLLEKSHYGLKKAKNRIVEYLSILKLTGRPSKAILCLVGPPGCGKTSLSKSVAKALGRSFVRISLGGMHDEAEIRGHRKTYIGAMPGQIIRKIKDCGVRNPVFLLDEIDKMGSDSRGDPSHALLEVLDSEQNKSFFDNYLEVPFDLSQVLFITTANSLSTIPRPLRDRMEIVNVTTYLQEEKVLIAKKYLLKKAITDLGLKDLVKVSISPSMLKYIITYYTRESGVRELNRLINRILKNVAKDYLNNSAENVFKINKELVHRYLDKPIYDESDILFVDEVGVVTGLAWTEVGGDILFVQTNIYNSSKESLVLTGRMGEVMQESARIALSVTKSLLDEIGKSALLENKEVHIHIPHQSVPKEGPSAGGGLVTSMLSAVLDLKVDRFLAMTGEINLRGDILPIGGLREKLTAAKNAGIKRVCIPEKNKRDIDDLTDSVKKGLEIYTVKHIKEVLKVAYKKDLFAK